MAWLAAIVLIAAFFAFRFLFHAFGCLRRRQLLRAGGSGLGCTISATFAGAGAMLLFSYLSYTRLVEEQPISLVQFRRISSLEFQARLMVPGEADRFFVLRGDEWQIDARIVTWKPPLTILGLDPIYHLDRLSGRYAQIDREQREPRTVHSLAPLLPADIWQVATLRNYNTRLVVLSTSLLGVTAGLADGRSPTAVLRPAHRLRRASDRLLN